MKRPLHWSAWLLLMASCAQGRKGGGWGGHDHTRRPQILQNAGGQRGCTRREAASPIRTGRCSRASWMLPSLLPACLTSGNSDAELKMGKHSDPSVALRDPAGRRGAPWVSWCLHVHLGCAGRCTFQPPRQITYMKKQYLRLHQVNSPCACEI